MSKISALKNENIKRLLYKIRFTNVDKKKLSESQDETWTKIRYIIDNNLREQKPQIRLRKAQYISIAIMAVLVMFTTATIVSQIIKSPAGTIQIENKDKKLAEFKENLIPIALTRFKDITKIDYSTYSELVRKNDFSSLYTTIENQPINYNERELSITKKEYSYLINEYFKQGDSDIHDSDIIDYSKPVQIKAWKSSTYSRVQFEQSNKLLRLHIRTSSYTIDYYGGKYAIKFIDHSTPDPDDKIYVNPYAKNTEVEFIENLINTNPIVTDIVKIDNREVAKIENQQQQDFSQVIYSDSGLTLNDTRFKNIYYVDIKTLELVQVEYANDKEIVKTVKNKLHKSLTFEDGKQEIINEDILKNIDIKEFNSSVYTYTNFKQRAKFNDFIKEVKLYYVDGIAPNNPKVDFGRLPSAQKEYDNTLYSSNYNPLASYKPLMGERTIIDYTQSFKIDFRITEGQVDPNQLSTVSPLDELSTTPIFIFIDGIKKDATFISRKVCNLPNCRVFNYTISFTENGFTYYISNPGQQEPSLLKEGLSIKALDEKAASQWDQLTK